MAVNPGAFDVRDGTVCIPVGSLLSTLLVGSNTDVPPVASPLADGQVARSATLEALTGFAITLVVIGHAAVPGPEPAPTYLPFMWLVDWIYTFHMPLFFAVSGYLLMHATLRAGTRAYPRYRAFLAGKARRLLAPYVIVSSLAFPVKVVMSRHAMHPLEPSLASYVENLLYPWNNTIIFFWFLPTLFFLFALAPFTLRPEASRTRDGLTLAVGALLWAAFPHENHEGPGAFLNVAGVLHNFVFFFVGFAIRKVRPQLTWLARPSIGLVALALSLATFAAFGTTTWAQPILVAAGMTFALGVASSPARPWLARLSDASFQIYLFSWFPQVLVRVVCGQWLALHGWGATVLSVALGIGLPLALTRLATPLVPPRYSFVIGR